MRLLAQGAGAPARPLSRPALGGAHGRSHNSPQRIEKIWTYRNILALLQLKTERSDWTVDMDIQKATSADLRGIQKCARAAYCMYIERMGRRPAPMVADFEVQIADGKVHVLSDGKTVAGYAVFYPREDHFHLENVAVHPDFQNLGYGLQLITYVEQCASDAGVNAVELYTNVKMTENLSLYPSLGYTEKGRWTEDGFERVFYRKELNRL